MVIKRVGGNEATHLLETAPPARPLALEAVGNGLFAPCRALLQLLGEYLGAVSSVLAPCLASLPRGKYQFPLCETGRLSCLHFLQTT